MHDGAYGCMYITCPECNEEILLDDEPPKTLTIDNIQWPKHFEMPEESDAKMEDATIQKWVRDCLKYLESEVYGNGDSMCLACGDSMVWVKKFENEYAIYVTRSYASSSIPREDTTI